MPVRVQRRRVKGWRMPAGAVYVGRPSKWGNPYSTVPPYREMAEQNFDENDLAELCGKDLACWCRLVDKDGNPVPCHADILLELANR